VSEQDRPPVTASLRSADAKGDRAAGK